MSPLQPTTWPRAPWLYRQSVCIALGICAQFTAPVAAQGTPPVGPASREGAFVCPRPTAAPATAAAGQSQGRRDSRPVPKDCTIDPDQVAKLLAAPGEGLIADVRPAAERSRFRIPGSVPSSPTEIRAAFALKNRGVVLVGSGRDDDLMVRTCAELRSSGFAGVKAMRGGMLSWQLQARTVEGLAPDLVELSTLSAEEAVRLIDNVDSSVRITVGTEARSKPATASPAAGSKAVVSPSQVQGASGPMVELLLLRQEEWSRTEVEHWLRARQPALALVYRGTAESLDLVRARAKASDAARARPGPAGRCG